MTCLILDDNPLARDVIRHLTSEIDDLTVAAECSSANEAFEFFKTNTVDLILLDMEMPEISGLEFLRKLKKRPIVIIISGHEKYALYGYEFNVADYLVKPVTADRFEQALEKVRGLIDAKQQEWKVQNKDFIFIKDNNVLHKINVVDINWLEAQGDYVKVHANERAFMVHTTLRSIEEKLPTQRFTRVHRSYVVPIEKIERIEENLIYIKGKAIPVSDSYWKEVKRCLNIL